jgi:hypothetical protein
MNSRDDLPLVGTQPLTPAEAHALYRSVAAASVPTPHDEMGFRPLIGGDYVRTQALAALDALTAQEVTAISAFLLASTRRNGKCLVTPDRARAMLAAVRLGGTTVRVDALMRVQFHGWYWSVLNAPGVHVGDLVRCWPTRRGVFLHVQAENEAQPSTLASRIERAHSLPHTCPPPDTPLRSGNSTTSKTPLHQCSCPGGRVAEPPQTPPAAKPQGYKRSRNAGTTGGAPGAVANSIALVLHVHLAPRRHRKGNGKSRSSWVVSFESLRG